MTKHPHAPPASVGLLATEWWTCYHRHNLNLSSNCLKESDICRLRCVQWSRYVLEVEAYHSWLNLEYLETQAQHFIYHLHSLYLSLPLSPCRAAFCPATACIYLSRPITCIRSDEPTRLGAFEQRGCILNQHQKVFHAKPAANPLWMPTFMQHTFGKDSVWNPRPRLNK